MTSHPMLDGRPLLIGDKVRIKNDGRIGWVRSLRGASRDAVVECGMDGPIVRWVDLTRVPVLVAVADAWENRE